LTAFFIVTVLTALCAIFSAQKIFGKKKFAGKAPYRPSKKSAKNPAINLAVCAVIIAALAGILARSTFQP
jgi:hypothetical protein